jgi:hypothetical protein
MVVAVTRAPAERVERVLKGLAHLSDEADGRFHEPLHCAEKPRRVGMSCAEQQRDVAYVRHRRVVLGGLVEKPDRVRVVPALELEDGPPRLPIIKRATREHAATRTCRTGCEVVPGEIHQWVTLQAA